MVSALNMNNCSRSNLISIKHLETLPLCRGDEPSISRVLSKLVLKGHRGHRGLRVTGLCFSGMPQKPRPSLEAKMSTAKGKHAKSNINSFE